MPQLLAALRREALTLDRVPEPSGVILLDNEEKMIPAKVRNSHKLSFFAEPRE
jgi:hypothetical protein